MPVLIVVAVLLVLIFAPGVLVIAAGLWAAYWMLVVAVAVTAGLALIAYAAYMFFVVYPRQDLLAMEVQRARSARIQASDDNIAATQAASVAAGAKIDGTNRQKKAAEDAIQAEIDEQIREAKIRKEIKARSAK